MNFSFIFPTRERLDLVKRFIDSIEQNTDNIHDVEVLVAVDEDDVDTFGFLSNLKCSFLKIFTCPRSLNFSRDYYTMLAHKSTGRWIITANDDCVMESKRWDTIAYNVLNDKSGVIYGWIEDGLGNFRAKGHGNYCCFPLQGRVGFEALGYIFPERVPTWGADIWAKNLYDQVSSVIEIPITMRHYCYHNHTREQDNISRRIQSSQKPFDMRPSYEEINSLLAAIKKEMIKI